MFIVYWPFFYSYDIEITDEIVGRAPIPELIVGVKQDGNLSFKLLLYDTAHGAVRTDATPLSFVVAGGRRYTNFISYFSVVNILDLTRSVCSSALFTVAVSSNCLPWAAFNVRKQIKI